jgi:hypothetical protein
MGKTVLLAAYDPDWLESLSFIFVSQKLSPKAIAGALTEGS